MEHCPQPSPKHAAVWIAFVLALVALAHSPALSGGFVWDDHQLIEDQRIVRELQPIGAYFASSFWSSPYDEARGFFRPLVTLSYALEWRLWDGNPLGFHTTNLLLHLLNCLLVYTLARKGRSAVPAALAATLLFGTFPRLTESVTWISGRTDLLAAFFALSAVLIHRSAAERPAARIGAAAAIFVGLLCKEVALAGAAAIGVFELRRLINVPDANSQNAVPARSRVIGFALRLVPLLAAGIIYAVLRLRSGTVVGSEALSLIPTRLEMALTAVGHYALMLLWPYSPQLQIGDMGIVEIPFAAAGAAILAGIVLLLVRLGVRRAAQSDAADLLAMSGFALLLVVHLIPLDVNIIAADRFLYVPAAGLAAAGAPVISRMHPRLTQRLHTGARILLPCLALAFLCRTWMSAQVWTDERGLWEKACLDASASNAAVWLGLAGILDDDGLSLLSLRATIKASTTDSHVSQAAAVNIAQGIQLIAGPEASVQLLNAFTAEAGVSRSIVKRAFLDLALVHARAGRPQKAIELLERYAAENPNEDVPRALLANVRQAEQLLASLPKAPMRTLTPGQLKSRYAAAELLSDRLAVTDALLEMVSRSDVDDATRNEAVDMLRARGLCHRLQQASLHALMNDADIARRCRPLPAEIERQLPPLALPLPAGGLAIQSETSGEAH